MSGLLIVPAVLVAMLAISTAIVIRDARRARRNRKG